MNALSKRPPGSIHSTSILKIVPKTYDMMSPYNIILILVVLVLASGQAHGALPELTSNVTDADHTERQPSLVPEWYQDSGYEQNQRAEFGFSGRGIWDETEAPEGLKSLAKARLLSSGTVVGLFTTGYVLAEYADLSDLGFRLMNTGWIVGPSIGVFYGEGWGLAFSGVAVRMAVSFAAAAGLAGRHLYPVLEALTDSSYEQENHWADRNLNLILLVGLASIVFDIYYSTSRAVSQYNEQLRKQQGVSVAPYIDPATGSAGLSARIRF